MSRALRRAAVAFTAALATVLAPTAARASTQVGGFVVGSAGFYDYSPTVIQEGSVQNFFWCGDYAGHTTDTIFHEQYSLSPSVHVTIPQTPVLSEGPAGAWDSLYTCNPDVVRGTFVDPLGDGTTYTWALYYVGTSAAPGTDNAIGVAFSLDGSTWVKYPGPVIAFDEPGLGLFGLGQPNVSMVGGVLTMLYERTDGAGVSHVEATSPDGVSWTTVGALVTTGLQNPQMSWGGAAFDPSDGRWYAAYNDALRPPSTTGGVIERGQPGVTLYSTADPLAGPWTELDTIDTNLTGYESNFIAALLRQADGTLYAPALPSVELYLSTSNPRPDATATPAQRGASGAFNAWDISWSVWSPGSPMRALTRYYASALGVHEVSTGWVDTSQFHAESVLGHLYEAPAGGFTRPLYGCVLGGDGYFVSVKPACEGQLVLGLDGYLSPDPGASLVALYRCRNGGDHFASTDPHCEGRTVEALLGYAPS